MKDIKVVIGANFGDEGKGLMTDYFCEKLGGRVLNVRFNGTSQAGHTVERDGKRHVFSHFGSGSMLPGVATYLSSEFFFNPIKFFEELEELEKLEIIPEVYLCNKSEAITIYDIFFNCIVETARGNERHGSCGAGLWEALNRQRAGYELKAKDIYEDRKQIRGKLIEIRDEYYSKRFEEMKVDFGEDNEWYEIWNSDTALDNYIDMLIALKDVVTVTDEEEILNSFERQVYEGAQGLLLDYGNRAYMPNLTASYTGGKNVVKLLDQIEGEADVEVCYVTRTYFTRHGAGRFETEAAKEKLDQQSHEILEEETNITNRWQGEFRWGYFDRQLFAETIAEDGRWFNACSKKKIRSTVAFTHVNKTDGYLLEEKKNVRIEDFINTILDKDERYYECFAKTADGVCVKAV